MKWKDSISRIAADKRGLQKRSIEIKRSLDEVNRLVNAMFKKKNN